MSAGRLWIEDAELPLAVGATFRLRFHAAAGGHARVLDIPPGRPRVALFPNTFSPDDRVEAGRDYSIPPPDSYTLLRIDEAGGETFVLLIGPDPEVLDALATSARGGLRARARERGVAITTREISTSR